MSEVQQHRWAGVREAAAYAACGLSKFWGMINRGDVYAVRHGRKVVVDLHSIDRLYEGLAPIGKRSLTAADIGLPEPDAPLVLQHGGS
jgi:hypothetical protein